MYGLKKDWVLEPRARQLVLADYEGGEPRWCPGCGDHAALAALQRLCRDEQLPPEKTMVVSGIGCSSRFPHYMKTYGFHGLHGRAFPVACGIRSRRPDLHMFVITGDGDCCAIGTAHWIHAIRYNMKMAVMLFDNSIYGLTKAQTSPTTPKGQWSNTHPDGALLSPINPLTVTLGVTNVSFVAQTVDWNPAHMYATFQAAHRHNGLAFVRILQRCPHFMDGCWDFLQKEPGNILMLQHEDGIETPAAVNKLFPNQVEHDPNDIAAARAVASRKDVAPIGLLYRNPDAERYDLATAVGLDMTTDDRMAGLAREVDRFVI